MVLGAQVADPPCINSDDCHLKLQDCKSQPIPHESKLGADPCVVPDVEDPETSFCCQPQLKPARKNSLLYSDFCSKSLSYPKWCEEIVGLVLKTRSPFASYVSKTIQLTRACRDTSKPTLTQFFPIPIAQFGVFGGTPNGSSALVRHNRRLSRTIQLISCAMNFWFFDGRHGDMELLRRKPSSQHLAFFQRVRLLVESEGPAFVDKLPSAGRRFPELGARLSELSDAITRMGYASNPYDKSFAGVEALKDDKVDEVLQPYHDADPDKLILHGRGAWDPSEFLEDELCLSFREPRVLLHGRVAPPGPNIRDSAITMSRLAMKWDDLDLLYLHREMIHKDSLVRIFGAYKSSEVHRQIGDKRGQNVREAKLRGPSCDLPSGADFVEMYIDPRISSMAISITDRKDFYHQLAAAESKAITNTIGPSIPAEMLANSKAYSRFMIRQSRKRYDRHRQGDLLREDQQHSGFILPPDGELWAAFQSVLQGDHAGVEVATQSHSSLLQTAGLLPDCCRMVASRPLHSRCNAEGLVIDDYFAISIQPKHICREDTLAYKNYEKAQAIYESNALLGSPHKDIIAQDQGKVIGAFLNASRRATDRGLVTVAAPAAKRISLSYITFQVCKLGYTTDALHLCLLGGWVSALGYRRPLMAILRDSFHLVSSDDYDRDHPKILHLPRQVVVELSLLATLVPLMSTDLTAPFHQEVFCTDASLSKGAILAANISEEISAVLWKSSRSKGAYTRLLSPLEAALKHLGCLEEKPAQIQADAIDRPLAFTFEFIEVFSGAAKITQHIARLGVSVGPPIDLSESPEFDLEGHYVIRWLTHLIASKKLRGFFLSPPCTTFSIMRRPRLRSKTQPLGINPADPQTATGTKLALRGLQTLKVGAQNHAAGILEAPFSAYTKHLPSWGHLRQLAEVSEARCDSCRYGSIHLKSFRFLGLRVNLEEVSLRCCCSSRHVQVEGKYTKASATYTDDLADALAKVLFTGIRKCQAAFKDPDELNTQGLESQLINDVATSAPWKEIAVWDFRKCSHINILEESVVYRLCSILAKDCRPKRVTILVDSNVVRCASSKGRTSSNGLAPILRKVMALCIAAGLYVSFAFVPTRLNASDDPTRDRDVRPSLAGLGYGKMSVEQLFKLSELPKLKRWASNWARLVLLSSSIDILENADRSLFRQTNCHRKPQTSMDFDATLGFPGEGPLFGSSPTFLFLFSAIAFLLARPCRWNFGFTRSSTRHVVGVSPPCPFLRPGGCYCCFLLLGFSPAMAMPISARTAGERLKAMQRAERPEIKVGRPVTEATSALRDRYWKTFEDWVRESGIDLEPLLAEAHLHVEDINILLSSFGRALYKAGKSYTQYAETINPLGSRIPGLRRLLQQSWDFGYAWVKHEPSIHHVAMPASIAVAMVTTALLWGWSKVAGTIALGFSALLRPGEIVSAVRKDLLLPRDVNHTINYGLPSIREPKSRFTHARHQSAKFDAADFLEVVDFAFGKIKDHERLWPQSPQTLRQRFKDLLQALHLPTVGTIELKALDLGSLRCGGATFLMQSTEDSELCRRRGRWANMKMMDIYVQETMALQYMRHVPATTRDHFLSVAGSFSQVLRRVSAFQAASIPSNAWYYLLSR